MTNEQNVYAAGIILIILIVVAAFAYFIPAYVGRRKRNAKAILMLNIFLGWTFIGWVIALVWAVTKDREEESFN